jgi:hypothetical protein
MKETWEAVAYQIRHMLAKLRIGCCDGLVRALGWSAKVAAQSISRPIEPLSAAMQGRRSERSKKSFFNCGGEELSRTYKSISYFPVGGKLWC